MVGYYCKLAARTVRKYKFHTTVSLVSLTTGFVCFIAANAVAAYLTSWDRHFPDSERIFTVNATHPNPRTDGLPWVPRHLARYLENDFPEIERAATARAGSREHDVTVDGATERMRITFVEGDYLQIFPLPLLSSAEPLAALPPGSALIMERAALERFGTTDVVGRMLVIGQRHDVRIAGVVRTMARPSHLQSKMPGADDADLVAPMRVLEALGGVAVGENWYDRGYRTYVKLAPGASLDMRDYAQRFVDFSERHVPLSFYTTGPHQTIFSFHPLTETGPSYFRFLFGNVPVTALLVFAGALVLLVACLNYSNLVIAQLTQRSHEITVQKVVGATRRHLVAQYSLESLTVAGLAFALALATCAAVLSGASSLRAMGFHAGLLLAPSAWIAAGAALLAITAIAGAYPALRVTREPLPSMLRPAGSTGGYPHRLRSLMVGTQFAFSTALMIFAIFVLQQNRLMLAQASDDALDPVFVLRGLVPESAAELERLEAALRRDASVTVTSRSRLSPWELSSDALPLFRAPDPFTPFIALNRIAVGHDYFDTMQMPLVAGRTFAKDRAADLYPAPAELRSALGPYSVVVDEATVARLGFGSAAEAIGAQVYTSYLPPVVDQPRFMPLTIVGVVANRPLEIAAIGYAPTHVFTLSPVESNNVLVRPAPGSIAAARAHIDRVWRELYPASSARPELLAEVFARSYAIVVNISNAIVGLALLAFGIASLGLITMATFIVRLRHREVGIRKILGANKRRVVRMLLLDFAKPVLIANLVAWPVGFGMASAYLSIFYVRAPITGAPFVLSLVLTLAVAVLAVLYQARGSSRLRPATIMKHE